MSRSPKIAVLPPESMRRQIFTPETLASLDRFGMVVLNTDENDLSQDDAAELAAGAEVIVTSWGSPNIGPAVVAKAPGLKLHCHGAGTVKPFVSKAEYDAGVVVTSAAPAIAISVAETTVAWMVVGAKRIMMANAATHAGGWKREMPLSPMDFRLKNIGIIGASHVGQRVIELLKSYENTILLYDPYVTEEAAHELGVRKVELDELMRESDIVSLHAPKTDETYRMINAERLALMKDGATFINTARGALVDEDALSAELESGRLWAFIDVTDPEPPAPDHPFRKSPNCVLTPHIAGCSEAGRLRIGDFVTEEIRRYMSGEPQRYPVRWEDFYRIG